MSDEPSGAGLEALLEYILANRGFDYTGYKRSSLLRRISRRRDEVGARDFAEYQDYLAVHPEEFAFLFNTILINVTSFFRDTEAWGYLQERVIPRLVDATSEHVPLRVWCPGCASGEETYTITMLLAEAMGIERFRQQVKIYATDADEEALAHARRALYEPKQLEPVPDAYRAKYFRESNGSFAFHGDLRRSVIFGRHDLIQDAPISRLALLSCRNTLMYFNRETQARILGRFHFALRDSGYLFLGRAEMLLTHGSLFTPVEIRHRIFRKVPAVDARELGQPGRDTPAGPATPLMRLPEVVFERGAIAEIVIDRDGRLMMANDRAREGFGLVRDDLGRPFKDLELSYRPIELRGPLAQVAEQGERVSLGLVERHLPDEQVQQFEVTVMPLVDHGVVLGAAVIFDDVTETHRLQSELDRSRQDLETAYEEVQSSNEELETTNEELQSANEELETTNEELQSANEELETMNAELQATNEELQAASDRLRTTSTEVDRANTYLSSILESLEVGVAVLDDALHVRLWNAQAEELWGVRADEVIGQPFLSLDIGLPVAEIEGLLRTTLGGESSPEAMRVDAVDRRGRRIVCRVTVSPLPSQSGGILGMTLLMEHLTDSGGDPGSGHGGH